MRSLQTGLLVLPLLVVVGLLPSATFASAGQVVVPRGQPVQIAVVLPESGDNAALGAIARNAEKMAVEMHSRIKGFPIQLNDFDGPCGLGPEIGPANAAAAAAVVANPQNVAVLGHFCSSGDAAALPIYQAAGVVTLSGSANNPILPGFGPDVFNSLVVPDGQADAWYAAVLALPSDIFWRVLYQEEFGSPAGPFADLYFDATTVLLNQIAASARLDHGNLVVDRTALAQAVRSTAGFRGVTCDITLDAQGFRVNDATSLAACAAKIAFASNRDGNFEIYSMNPDGSGQARLTNNQAQDVTPSFSTDGTKIAFESTGTGNGDIYVMNADGTGVNRLASGPAIDGAPTFSPDATKIAFASFRTGNGDIYVMNADGNGLTRLTTSPYEDWEPAWSPDGTKIAFTSGRTGNGDIYVMNAGGTKETRLTTSDAIDSSPAWSLDGTTIFFTSNRDGNFEIYSMNSDGSGQTRLTNNPAFDGDPTFLASGRVVFTSNRDANFEIYSMNPDGSGQTRLTFNPTVDVSPAAP